MTGANIQVAPPNKDNCWKKAEPFRSGAVEERELLKKPQDAAIEAENVLRKRRDSGNLV
jgi:hypothetical protein